MRQVHGAVVFVAPRIEQLREPREELWARRSEKTGAAAGGARGFAHLLIAEVLVGHVVEESRASGGRWCILRNSD